MGKLRKCSLENRNVRVVHDSLCRDMGFGDSFSLQRECDNKCEASGFRSRSEAIGWAEKFGWKVM
jgi:hypothetical protein